MFKIIPLALLIVSSITFGKGEKVNKQSEGPKIVFAVIHKPGPNWKSGVDFREQPGVKDHIMHYRKWYTEGKLSLGGPYLDNSGGMMITVPGLKREDVDKFAADDPSVKNGLLLFEVKPWMIAMEKE
jgi:uncharacterized protein YciI